MRKLLSIVFLLCLSTYVNAQAIAISTEVTSHDERAVVDYSGMKCATEGATAIYNIIIEGCDSIEEVPVCKYVFNDKEVEASYTLDKGTLTINNIAPTLVVGVNELSFNLSVKEKGKESLTILSNTAVSVRIYPIPTHKEVKSPLYYTFCKETGKLSWSANGEGGTKWEYTWESTENTTGSSSTFDHPSIVNGSTSEKEVTITLKATNYAPDGTTIWDSYDGSWIVKVYPATVVNPIPSPNSAETPNKLFQGDSWDLSVLATGGNSEGWKIEWRDADNGNLLGEGKDYKLTSTATNHINTKHVLLHVLNVSPEGAQYSSWFDESYDYYIRFYPIPQVEFTDSYPQDVLDGEVIQMGLRIADTEMRDDYVLYYDWGGSHSSTYRYEASNSYNDYGTQNTIKVKCTFGLTNTEVKSGYQELSHTFTVWPKPSVTATNSNSSDMPYRQFQDGKWDLSVNSSGGYRTGWKYIWKDENGKVLGSGEKYTLTCDKTSDDVQEKHVTLTVTNQPQDQSVIWFEQTYDYFACFYPSPIVKFEKDYPQNIKHGDVISLALLVLDAKGNSADDAYNISYSWNNDESKNTYYEYHGENPNNNDGVKVTITVNCTVELKGTNLKQPYKRQISFVVWPEPTVDVTGISDRIGCGGQSLNFILRANGGKKDGWAYEWFLDEQTLNVITDTYVLELDNAPVEDSIINNYKVRVTNTCDGEMWYDKTYPFNVTVYPKPRIPESVVIMDKNREAEVSTGIREGNNLILHCDECMGGYPNGWSYKWLRNNNELGTQKEINDIISSGYSGSGKANDLVIEYSCYVENLYNTVPWMRQDYKKEIRVYRKPQTPTSLRKKGNGASGTWVATFEMDDASLGSNDYFLVFGYRDANGDMHDVRSVSQQNVGEQRWSVFDNTEGRNNAYVYALWKYGDGAEVTSGLCLESHIDEDWDGSTYNGVTRSVIADATGISALLSTTTDSDGCQIYTINGQKSNHMNKGLNIIRRNDGQFVKYVNNK